MAYILVKLNVTEFEKWKRLFDNGFEQRKEHGQSSHQVFQSFQNQNEISILFQWDNLENATSYFENESLISSLREFTVDGKLVIEHLEELEMIRQHIIRKEKFDH